MRVVFIAGEDGGAEVVCELLSSVSGEMSGVDSSGALLVPATLVSRYYLLLYT